MKIFLFILVVAISIGGYLGYENYVASHQLDSAILYGNVDIRDVNLSFRVSGRVEEMFFEEGDIVKKGDLVAKLNPDPFQDEVNAAQAEVQAIEAINFNAHKSYQRAKELFEKGTGSETAYDDASANLLESKARINVAKAKLELVKTQLDDTQLIAPSDGIVINRVHEVGAIVNYGQTVYTLALDKPVWVRSYVTEAQLGTIYPGMKVKVSTDSQRFYEGQIGFISPQAEFTPKSVETQSLRTDLVYRLRIIVTDSDIYLRQGMPVTIELK